MMAIVPVSSLVFHGGRPSLDFVNTLRKRKDPLAERVDALEEYGVRGWLAAARRHTSWASGIPNWREQTSTVDLPPNNGSQVLREAIYQLLADQVALLQPHTGSHCSATSSASRRNDSVEIINSYAREPLHYELKSTTRNRLEVGELLNEQQLLGFISSDAVQLLGGEGIARVKECENPRCGIMFEDHSNGLRRRWCSMQVCGNSSKAERFANRSKTFR